MSHSIADAEVAKDRLLETWDTTRDVLAPRLTAAREVVTPYVDTAAARVVAAAGIARDNSAPARAEAKERAAEAIRALRGERSAHGRRWPLAVICLLVGAVLGSAVGMMRRKPEPYVPAPTPWPPSGQTTQAPTATAAGASRPSSDQPAG